MTDSNTSNSFSNISPLSDDPIFDILGVNHQETAETTIDQETIAALAYSAPAAPLDPQLKQHLFSALGLQLPSDDLYALLNLSIQALKLKADTLPWEPIDAAPGFETAIYQEDDSTRRVACFIRADDPAAFPNHFHPSEEVILVLSGDLIEDTQVYTSGDRIYSTPDSSHQLDTTQGCLLFCIASMDNQF